MNSGNHEEAIYVILLQKLEKYGIRGLPFNLQWFTS